MRAVFATGLAAAVHRTAPFVCCHRRLYFAQTIKSVPDPSAHTHGRPRSRPRPTHPCRGSVIWVPPMIRMLIVPGTRRYTHTIGARWWALPVTVRHRPTVRGIGPAGREGPLGDAGPMPPSYLIPDGIQVPVLGMCSNVSVASVMCVPLCVRLTIGNDTVHGWPFEQCCTLTRETSSLHPMLPRMMRLIGFKHNIV